MEVAERAGAMESFNLLELPSEVLTHMLNKLPMEECFRTVSLVCKTMAGSCENIFKQYCSQRRWSFPRRPRGRDAVHHHYPWRSLYGKHACVTCCGVGEFHLRLHQGAQLRNNSSAGLVCKKCTRSAKVQRHLQRNHYFIDAVGVSGKRLLPALPQKGAKVMRNRWGRL